MERPEHEQAAQVREQDHVVHQDDVAHIRLEGEQDEQAADVEHKDARNHPQLEAVLGKVREQPVAQDPAYRDDAQKYNHQLQPTLALVGRLRSLEAASFDGLGDDGRLVRQVLVPIGDSNEL